MGICYYHGSYFVTLVLLLDHLKLLVSGDGAVIPATYKQIMPGIVYSLQVGLSTQSPSGRVRISMRRGFCTDAAGNLFQRTANSSVLVHFGMYVHSF
jgi:hypothetical protein